MIVDLSDSPGSGSSVTAAAAPIDATQGEVDSQRRGYLLGVGAYVAWGLFPIYFRLLKSISSVSIVAFRICWSLVVILLLLTVVRGWPAVGSVLRDRRAVLLLTASAALIAVNWLVYVFAVNNGHILASSLGYYLNPIANILLGRFLLKEPLSRLQWCAIAIAAAGVALLSAQAIDQLGISLVLCLSFASYGFVRKVVAADALTGLAVETGLLAPFALGWLLLQGSMVAAASPVTPFGWLVALSGLLTSMSLLMFAAAARRLPYSTLGMLQFLAPTLQFLLAVFLYGEAFTRTHAVAFAAIWSALALYVAGIVQAGRRARLSATDRDGNMQR